MDFAKSAKSKVIKVHFNNLNEKRQLVKVAFNGEARWGVNAVCKCQITPDKYHPACHVPLEMCHVKLDVTIPTTKSAHCPHFVRHFGANYSDLPNCSVYPTGAIIPIRARIIPVHAFEIEIQSVKGTFATENATELNLVAKSYGWKVRKLTGQHE